MTHNTRFTRHNGFTLIELLVVLAILAMLAGVVGPRVMNALSDSNVKTARIQIEDLGAGLDLFRLDVGRYPTTGEGLEALVERPAGVERWNGPYLKKLRIPKDPWSRDYLYTSPGEHGSYDLVSLGADGTQGGTGEAQDVVSWE